MNGGIGKSFGDTDCFADSTVAELKRMEEALSAEMKTKSATAAKARSLARVRAAMAEIAEARGAPQPTLVELRGGNWQAFASRDDKLILAGAADTGKTWAMCLKLHVACSMIPGVQALVVRKNFNALAGTVVQTFLRVSKIGDLYVRDTAPDGTALSDKTKPLCRCVKPHPYGGETPTRFIYPNGSVVWLGGMDNPESCLSSERDVIYANQAEELSLNDWELLSSRCTGRGGVLAFPQMLGDCNPAGPKHWIRTEADDGRLKLLRSTHKDNPALYDRAGNLLDTDDARRRIKRLEGMTGVRRKRYFEGVWAVAEGAVFDMFDRAVHVCERAENQMSNWYLAQDQGCTNPATIVLVGVDPDGRWHIFREFYKRGWLEADVVAEAAKWNVETVRDRRRGRSRTRTHPCASSRRGQCHSRQGEEAGRDTRHPKPAQGADRREAETDY